MQVFGRAGIQRTVFVVALLVTAGAANAFAREFRAADTQSEEHQTVQALHYMGRQIAERSIRVQQSEQISEMMRGVGAAPVELPYGQVPAGLATRPIDGAESNWPSFVTTDHHENAGRYTRTEHMMSPEVLVMAPKARETLPPGDRKMLREQARRSSQFERLRKVE